MSDAHGKFLCTKDHPWKLGMPTPVEHDAVHEIADHGDTARYKCDNCGHEWTSELPQ